LFYCEQGISVFRLDIDSIFSHTCLGAYHFHKIRERGQPSFTIFTLSTAVANSEAGKEHKQNTWSSSPSKQTRVNDFFSQQTRVNVFGTVQFMFILIEEFQCLAEEHGKYSGNINLLTSKVYNL
jgi:hypothetical protein